MKLALAIVAVSTAAVGAANSAAKAAYTSKLLKAAIPTANSQLGIRRAEEEVEDYEVSLAAYSLKFEQCQFVKAYSDDLADDEESTTVLDTKRFVIFRMCPTGSCDTCSENFGEYVIDLETYIATMVEYQTEMQEGMCKACQECGNYGQNADGDANNADGGRQLQGNNYYGTVDCDSCYDECMKIENMEANGYIDATNFLECVMIYDSADDGGGTLYAGPMCASGGTKIKIGVFTDQYCNVPDLDKDVDDYLLSDQGVQMKLSHALLKTVYSSECIDCTFTDPNQEDGQNDNRDENANQVLDMCDDLYEGSAKCETSNGFANGYAMYGGYENQVAQEGTVCDFIHSLKAGSYDQLGEIVVSGANSSWGGGAQTTGGQKFALTFFILGTVGLAGYAAMLHSKLTKNNSSPLGGESGGAMA
jgi:hypothetical protein